jgi:hypothetical protein
MNTYETTPIWNFSVLAEGHRYDVVWEKRFIVELDYTTYGITVQKDGEQAGISEPDVLLAVKAAAAYKNGQINAELKQHSDYYKRDVVKDFIVELYERSTEGEYLGQLVDELLYVDTVVKILDTNQQRVYELIRELIEEERLGTNGAILISYEELAETRKHWEEQVGHKQFSRSDLPDGMWGCTYCGSTGWLDDVAPTEVECVKDAYKNEEGMSTFFTHQEEDSTSSE